MSPASGASAVRSSTSPTVHAVRLGLRRGWTEFTQSLRSSQDQTFFLVTAVIAVGYLWLRRNSETGTDLPFAAFALPGLLVALLAFGMVIGPAYQLAMEREDGTLLRHRAMPGGMVGYVSGALLLNVLGAVPQLTAVLVPSFLLFDVLPDARGWLALAWLLPLTLLALLPIGMVLGAVVPGVQKVGSWGMLPVGALFGISGIFFPVAQLWGWVQVVAQAFPLYWAGHGLRWAFLPDAVGAAELHGGWQPGIAAVVLGAWAVGGALLVPVVLRRMARRQSGSAVAAAQAATLQWTR